jgi:hypothetical protein
MKTCFHVKIFIFWGRVTIVRIVAWNCRMAFRNKYEKMYQYNPDIMIIPECEDLSKKKHEGFL